MPRIFISYRREDTPDAAGRLYDALAQHFGGDHVFLDVDTIPPGADFVEFIEAEVARCDVLIALIGRQWLTVSNGAGRRLDQSSDFVRLEIAAALRHKVRVIPVLVQGATMPGSNDLPRPLKRLARRNAVELRHATWRSDVDALSRDLNVGSTSTVATPILTQAGASSEAHEQTGSIQDRKKGDNGTLNVPVVLPAAGPAETALQRGLLGVLVRAVWRNRRFQLGAVSIALVALVVATALQTALPHTSEPRRSGLEPEQTEPLTTVAPAQTQAAELDASPTTASTSRPRRVDLSPWVTIRDIGDETIAAMATVVAMEVAMASRGERRQLSARYLYEKAKLTELSTVDTPGSFLPSIVYVAEYFGVPPEQAWPYRPNDRNLPARSDWPSLDRQAAVYKARLYRLRGIDDILPQLQLARPVIGGVRLYSSWTGPAAAVAAQIPLPSSGDQMIGTGAITFVGYEPDTAELKFANSWGRAWGDRGFGTMSPEVATALVLPDQLWAVEMLR